MAQLKRSNEGVIDRFRVEVKLRSGWRDQSKRGNVQVIFIWAGFSFVTSGNDRTLMWSTYGNAFDRSYNHLAEAFCKLRSSEMKRRCSRNCQKAVFAPLGVVQRRYVGTSCFHCYGQVRGGSFGDTYRIENAIYGVAAKPASPKCKNTGAQPPDLNEGFGDFGIYHNECGGRIWARGRRVLQAAPVYFKY